MADELTKVPLSKLRENPDNPRKSYGDLGALGETLRSQGMIEPIIVRRLSDGGLEIVAGHRRARAAKLIGWKEVDVVIRSLSRQQGLEVALVENKDRQSLNALEEAEGYAKLMSDFGMTADEVAERVGVSRASVYQATGLLELAEPVKRALISEKITPSAALELTKVRGSERLQLQALADVLKLGKNGEKAPARKVRRLIQDRYLSTAKKGLSKRQLEVREHGVDVATRRRVVVRLLTRIAELVERRPHHADEDLRTMIIALADAPGDTAREVFQRRGLRPDRLGKVGAAQLRSLVVELVLAPWLTLDAEGEYSTAVRSTAKAYGLSLAELTAAVEATGNAEALFAKS